MATTERILRSAGPTVGGVLAGTPVIVAPFQLLFTGEDHLRIRAWCSVAGVTLNIASRFLLPDGTIEAALHTMLPTSDRAASVLDIKLTRGYLLNLVVRSATANVIGGQCFVTVSIIRGDAATIVIGQLLAGYVSFLQMLGWPGSPITPPTDGAGAVSEVIAAGSVFASLYDIAVPAGARWRLNSLWTSVSAGAAVADRQLVFRFLSGGFRVFELPAPLTFPALSAQQITFARGLPWQSVGGVTPGQACPLPLDVDLRAAATIELQITNYQVGDQYVALGYQVTEWLEAA